MVVELLLATFLVWRLLSVAALAMVLNAVLAVVPFLLAYRHRLVSRRS